MCGVWTADGTHLTADGNVGDLGFESVHELRLLSVEELRGESEVSNKQKAADEMACPQSREADGSATYMELLRVFAQGQVVLLDEVPADLILGQVAVVGAAGVGGRLLRVINITVGRHGGHGCGGGVRVRGGQLQQQ